MSKNKKLAEVPHFRNIDGDVACDIFVVGHLEGTRQYYTIAQSRKVAALAYVVMLGAENTAVPIAHVWVRDATGVQNMPLLDADQNSIHNWLDAKPQRAKWIQAAVNHLHPIITA